MAHHVLHADPPLSVVLLRSQEVWYVRVEGALIQLLEDLRLNFTVLRLLLPQRARPGDVEVS